MTKFILVGGFPYKAKDGGKTMCELAVMEYKQPVKLLICLFARPIAQWDKLYLENQDFFKKNLPNIKIKFGLSKENNFVEQIQNTDVIYFSGGDTKFLTDTLNKNLGWQKALTGKTVMGSSAGTDILSKYNYDLEFDKCADGYGLLPIKTIVHYKSEEYTPKVGWQKAVDELKSYKEDLPIIALKEGEHKFIEI